MSSRFIELENESSSGLVTATIDTLGATLRMLVVNGNNVIAGYGIDKTNDKSAGEVLIPWPNRVRDGIWVHDGQELQLEINEEARNNAIHGLVRDLQHSIVSQKINELVLRCELEASKGYPFELSVETKYLLTVNGIDVTHLIVNKSETNAPVAIGLHPYLQIEGTLTKDLIITLNAKSRVDVDERLNPIGIQAIADTRFDLNNGERVGDLDLDTAYCDLIADTDGIYRHSLEDNDGNVLQVWADENYKHAQVYTTDGFNPKLGIDSAVAIEPTTAPPNAFNSGTDLKWLEPKEKWLSKWGIVLINSR